MNVPASVSLQRRAAPLLAVLRSPLADFDIASLPISRRPGTDVGSPAPQPGSVQRTHTVSKQTPHINTIVGRSSGVAANYYPLTEVTPGGKTS